MNRLAAAGLGAANILVTTVLVFDLVAAIVGLVGFLLIREWLVVALGLLYALQLHYLSLLGRWLQHPALTTIPDGFGAWAQVYARLYRWHRASEITQRRLIDNEERFRRTVSALPDGIVLIDAVKQ